MDLQHVDVRPQARDALVDGVEDVLARQADAVDELRAVVGARREDGRLRAVLGDAEVAFGQDGDLVTRDGVLLERLADDFFAAAVRVDVRLLVLLVSERPGLLESGKIFAGES